MTPLPSGMLQQAKPRTYIQSSLTVKKLLQGIEHHDFDEIYFVGSTVYAVDETKTEGSVDPTDPDAATDPAPAYLYSTEITPYITTRLVDASLKNGLDPLFVPQPSPAAAAVGNPVADFFFMSVYAIIAVNILRTGIDFFQQWSRRGGRGRRPDTPGFIPQFLHNKPPVAKENITLSDWAGSPEVLQECSEIVSYLNNRTRYENAGATIPRGILMEGPPGTGKTLLAKAIANEADAEFIEMSGSEFVEMYVGLGALRVRKLFEDARAKAPCVVFIDEMDAVGKRRSNSADGPASGGNDEKDQTLNQLLSEMDGFRNNTGVLILAATNRRDILDPALLRPGRFDRIVNIPLPDARSRRQILELYLGKRTQTGSNGTIDTQKWAKMTAGNSGADLRNLINEASMLLARRDETVITDEVLAEAWEKRWVGIKKTVDDRSVDVRRRVAIHEIGHAWMAHTHKEVFELSRVSIQPSYSGTGGFTITNERDGLFDGLYTRDVLVKRIMMNLGGKAAEEVFYGAEHVSVGATMDLNQANALAVDMIEKYGMGAQLNTFYKGTSSSFFPTYSDYTQRQIDQEAGDIVKEAYEKTVATLRRHRAVVQALAEELLDKTVMDYEGFMRVVGSYTSIEGEGCDDADGADDDDCGCRL